MKHVLKITISADRMITYDDDYTLDEAIAEATDNATLPLENDGYGNIRVDVENLSADALGELLEEEGWVVSMQDDHGTALLANGRYCSLLTIDPDGLSLWTVDGIMHKTVFHEDARNREGNLIESWYRLKKKLCEKTCARS